ncbi:restriction endonuclease [Alkalibacillus haloalkaliphilus]|uniref:restriction endonuclease n=1 Tax=Alkalibacillus haloalkaliphilus TaxID=94136 RepID=UPI0002EC1770|nr:restriction endonuclease [Alkalibacillus haloalkaliphilus]
MNKKESKNAADVISGAIVIVGIFLIFQFSLSIYYIFGLLIGIAVLHSVLTNLFHTKSKSKTKNNKNKTNKKPKTKPKKSNDVPHNRMLNDDEILKLPLERLSWREFERLCFLYFKDKGYKPQETSEGADGGVDLLIYNRHHQTYEAVQIKHYIRSGNEITVRELRELSSAKRNHNCLLARFITSSRFSNEAMKQADVFKVKTHGIDWLNSKVVPWKEQKAKIQIK